MQRIDHPLLAGTLGTSRSIASFHYGVRGASPKIYVQASLHADEVPGMLVAHHLRERLAVLEAEGAVQGEIVIVPVANPLGLSQWLLRTGVGRFDLASGDNFNRHYPSLLEAVWARVEPSLGADARANAALVRTALRDSVAALPEPTELDSLRRTLLALACDADVVLDLHCDAEAVLHLYTGTPLWPQAELLARCLGVKVSLLATDSGDQPFDEACSQLWWQLADRAGAARPVPLACLAATIELRGSADVNHAFAARDAGALIDFMAHRGALSTAADTAAPPPLERGPLPLAGSLPLTTPVSGLLAWRKAPGDWVRAGEALADVIDPVSATVTVLTSGTDGLLYARENRRFVAAGMRLAKIAGEQPLRSGRLLSA